MKLYTVQEYIKEMGISRSTLQRWVNEGRLKGLIPEGKSYLIPEENLSLPVQRKRKSKKRPILTEIQAREAYNNISYSRWGKLKEVSYDDLKEMFDNNMTLEAIAQVVGVTKQRVSQLYNRFFSFGVDGYERRSAIKLEATRDKELKAVMDSERISHLGKVAMERGLSIKPVQVGGKYQYYRNSVEINGHLCKIQLSRRDSQFSGPNYRSYNRILVTAHFLDSYEFFIAITGEEKKRIFIIPTEDLKALFKRREHRKPLYLPTSDQGIYRNLNPVLDWIKYQDAWHLLESSA